MKPVKLTPLGDALRQAIILASVLTVLATALVISLISYSGSQKSQQKLSAPAKVENIPSKPVQPAITPQLVIAAKTLIRR
jgi:hypothetical protein